MRIWLVLAGLNGAVAVAMAAAAAHAFGADADAAARAGRAADLQLVHAVALLGVALLAERRPGRAVAVAGTLFTLGILLFSGSLYALAFHWVERSPLAPMGGGSLILGWLTVAVAGAMAGPARKSGDGR